MIAPARPATAQRWAALVEDVEFLLSWGTPWVEVCARLGRTPAAMIRALYRLGRADLGAACHRATARRLAVA